MVRREGKEGTGKSPLNTSMPPTFLASARHVLSESFTHRLLTEKKIAFAGFYEGPGRTVNFSQPISPQLLKTLRYFTRFYAYNNKHMVEGFKIEWLKRK